MCNQPYVVIQTYDPKTCPFFNPLSSVPEEFVDFVCKETKCNYNGRIVLMNAIKVLKRLDKNEDVDGRHATLINLSRLLQNSGEIGRKMVVEFSQISSKTREEAMENSDIAMWFLNDYLSDGSTIFQDTENIRSFLVFLNQSSFSHMFNPDFDAGERNNLDPNSKLLIYFVECNKNKLKESERVILDWIKSIF